MRRRRVGPDGGHLFPEPSLGDGIWSFHAPAGSCEGTFGDCAFVDPLTLVRPVDAPRRAFQRKRKGEEIGCGLWETVEPRAEHDLASALVLVCKVKLRFFEREGHWASTD